MKHQRNAYSLLEILVVLALLLSMVGAFVLYYVSGQKQSLSLGFQAAALQTAQIVVATLQQDLASFVPGPLAGTYAAPTPAFSVRLTRVSDSSNSLGLPLDPHDELQTEAVNWVFDPQTHELTRNGETVHSGPLESAIFTFFPSRPGDPTPPFGDTLILQMEVVPTEALGHVTSATPKAAFTVEFHSPQGTVNHLHEEWVGDN
jgi:type II secretory pathway pseudopilin PulG